MMIWTSDKTAAPLNQAETCAIISRAAGCNNLDQSSVDNARVEVCTGQIGAPIKEK